VYVKEKHGEIHLDGEVLDHDERKVSRHGSSDHVSLPKAWVQKYLKGTVLELTLIRDSEGDLCIVAHKPKAETA
jgi:putative transposon-encoded protein